jgi:NAD(P)H-dependent FMN reductase
MTASRRLLLISGSLRAGSTNTAVLATTASLAPAAVLFDGLSALPHYNPDDDVEPLPEGVVALRQAIRDADAMVISTPEYAGALPGSLKNALEWSIGDGRPGSIYGKPTGWINPSAAPRGAADAYASLRIVLTYASAALVEDACIHVPVTRGDIGPDGLIADPDVVAAVIAALEALLGATSGR